MVRTEKLYTSFTNGKRLQINEDGVLCHHSGGRVQVVIPKSLRRLVLQELHDNMGHQGPERVMSLARERVYWYQMQNDVESYTKQECECVSQKKPNFNMYANMQSISSSFPGELVCIGFVHLETSPGEYLTIVGHFSQFLQAI